MGNGRMDALAVILEAPERLRFAPARCQRRWAMPISRRNRYSGISTGTETLLWTGKMPSFPGMGYPLVRD